MTSKRTIVILTLVISLTIFGLGASDAGAQGTPRTSLEECLSLLPADGEMGSWARAGTYRHFPGKKLVDHIAGGADLLYEYDFQRAIVQNYISEEKEITLEIYQFKEPSDAFGVYSINQGQQKLFLEPELEGRLFEGFLELWRGSFYIVMQGGGQGLWGQGTLVSFARFIASKIEQQGEKPDLLAILPAEERLPHSERYIRGPLSLKRVFPQRKIPGISGETKTIAAKYQTEEDEYDLLIVEYTDETASKLAYDDYLELVEPSKIRSAENALATLEDDTGYAAVRHCGKRLIFAFEVDDPDRATATVQELCWE